MKRIVCVLFAVLLGLPAVAHAGSRGAKRRQLTPAMFEMLGLADEYISRFDYITGKPRPGLVESFYPHEIKLSQRYERLIKAHIKQSGVKLKYTRKVHGQGHISFHSPGLAATINSFYRLEGKLATLDHRHLFKASRKNQLRYLKGAYARYGRDASNLFAMANATYKVTTIGRLLKKLGCTRVEVYTTRTLPTGTDVFFVPGKRLARELGITRNLDHGKYTGVAHRSLFKKL